MIKLGILRLRGTPFANASNKIGMAIYIRACGLFHVLHWNGLASLLRVHVGVGTDLPARTVCWPTAIVANLVRYGRTGGPMLARDRFRDSGTDTVKT